MCFHLAENRRDPDYPFAFLATYTPSVTSGGRVQYQPPSKALAQYAGAKNKNALINWSYWSFLAMIKGSSGSPQNHSMF